MHAVSVIDVPVRRLVTDTQDPGYNSRHDPTAGLHTDARNQRKRNTLANRKRGGQFPGTWKPNAEWLLSAPREPVTETPVYGGVKPSGGRRIGLKAEQARADSENAARSAWVSARASLERESGDVLPAGAHYPSYVRESGSLGPAARY